MSLIRRAVGLAFVIITAPSTTQAQPIPADKGNELPRVVRLTAPGPVYREWPVYRVWFVADGERVLGLTARGWVTWPTSGGPATTLVDDALLYAHDNERREWYSDVSADGRVAVDVVCEPVSWKTFRPALRIVDLRTGTTRRIPLNTSPWLVRLSPDGRRISTPLAGKETVVWDTVTGAVVDRRPEPPYAEARLLVRQPASDGPGLRWSVTAVPNPRPPTIGDNVATPEHIATHLTDHRTGRRIELAPSPWYTEGHCGQLTRDDTRFVLRCDYGGQPAGSVAVWDTRTGERLMRWDSPKLWRESVAVSADGRSLLACHDRDLGRRDRQRASAILNPAPGPGDVRRLPPKRPQGRGPHGPRGLHLRPARGLRPLGTGPSGGRLGRPGVRRRAARRPRDPDPPGPPGGSGGAPERPGETAGPGRGDRREVDQGTGRDGLPRPGAVTGRVDRGR
jgi:hypothetical protein